MKMCNLKYQRALRRLSNGIFFKPGYLSVQNTSTWIRRSLSETDHLPNKNLYLRPTKLSNNTIGGGKEWHRIGFGAATFVALSAWGATILTTLFPDLRSALTGDEKK